MANTSSDVINRLLFDLDGISKTAGLSVSGSNVLPKKAAPMSEPTGQTTSSGPTVSADDGLQTQTTGAEETKQKADASKQSPIGPDATGKITTPAQESVQQDLGVTQAGVGKDPSVEKDMGTTQKDPGEGTSTSALTFAGNITSKDASEVNAEDLVKSADNMTAVLAAFLKTAGVAPAPAAPAATPATPATAPAATPKEAATTTPAATPAAPAATTPAATTPAQTEEQKLANEMGPKIAALATHFVSRGVKKADLVVGYLQELDNQKRAAAAGGKTPSGFSFLKRSAESEGGGGDPSGSGSSEEPSSEKPKPTPDKSEGGGGGDAPAGLDSGGAAGGGGGGDALNEIAQVLQEMGMTPEDLLQLLKSVGTQPPPGAGPGMGGGDAGGAPGGAAPGGAMGGAPGGPAPTPDQQMMVAAQWYGNLGYLQAAADNLKTASTKFVHRPAKTAEEQARRNEIRGFIREVERRTRK